MQPGQIAIIWMIRDQQERYDADPRRAHKVSRPSFAERFGGQVRRLAFRAQLGPVGSQAAA